MAKLQQEMSAVAKAAPDNQKDKIITELRSNDVLCGKEKNCVNHPGSRNFRAVIDQYALKYNEAITKQQRMEVTKEIYDSLGAQNGRFLKYNSKVKSWVELSSLLARDKISHALRFANRESAKSPSMTSSARSSECHHRRGGSETSAGSGSTFTTVATELSFEEDMDGVVGADDDEPLDWKAEDGAEQPCAYEIPAENRQYPSYYHHNGHYYSHHYYAYPPYGHYNYHYYYPESRSTYPASQAPAEMTTTTEYLEPQAPVRKSSMDIDLSFLVSEPLMEWDMTTDEVYICD